MKNVFANEYLLEYAEELEKQVKILRSQARALAKKARAIRDNLSPQELQEVKEQQLADQYWNHIKIIGNTTDKN